MKSSLVNHSLTCAYAAHLTCLGQVLYMVLSSQGELITPGQLLDGLLYLEKLNCFNKGDRSLHSLNGTLAISRDEDVALESV